MKHTFTASQLDNTLCATCKLSEMSHTDKATCDSCDKVATCDIIDDMLLCDNCMRAHLLATKDNIETEMKTAEEIIRETKKIDTSIRYSGDFFNAKTISINEIKESIWADENIPANEKQFKFQSVIADRYAHLKKVIHESTVEQLIISKTLRDLGNDLRNEIRDKIKEVDGNYVPVKIKPKIKAPVKKNPMDRMIEAYALLKGCTLTEAKIAIEKGSK